MLKLEELNPQSREDFVALLEFACAQFRRINELQEEILAAEGLVPEPPKPTESSHGGAGYSPRQYRVYPGYTLSPLSEKPTSVLDGIPIMDEIGKELARAVAKFPTWPTDPLHALAVLGEEYGELTQAVLQHIYEPYTGEPDDRTGETSNSASAVRSEAIQTAAMAIRFLIGLESGMYKFNPSEQA